MLCADATAFFPSAAWQELCWAQQCTIALLLQGIGGPLAHPAVWPMVSEAAQRPSRKDAGTQAEETAVLRHAAQGSRAPPPEGPWAPASLLAPRSCRSSRSRR